jgi:hypothetical protein
MSETLDSLFGSKSKTRLLRFFLLNSESEFPIIEISKKNMLPSARTRSEINEFKKIKFVIEHVKKGKKSYSLNPGFHFINELRSLFAKSTSSPQCKSLVRVKNIGEVKLALISGIFLNYPKSKVDMMIVANNVSRSKLKNLMGNLEAEIGKEVSFMLLSSEEFKYRLDMLDRFLLDFLEAPHEELVNKIPGFKRIVSGLKKY